MSLPFTTRPSRACTVILDDAMIDAIDLVRIGQDDHPSRSAVMRDLIGFALAMILDDDAADAFIQGRLEAKRLAMEAPAGNA